MIAPTLPPTTVSSIFYAGVTTNAGPINAFSDTKSVSNPLAACGTRTCTSDSPYVVWD